MTEDFASIRTENLEKVQRYVKALPEDAFEDAKGAFQTAALEAANQVKAMPDLHVRSGALRRSIEQEVSGSTLNDLFASIYSAKGSGTDEVIYAPIHEFGGTIRPIDKYLWVKGGPYLNIPTEANKTAAGVTRYKARELFNMGAVVAGKAVIVGDQIMMTLVKGPVRIPPRLGMRDAAEDQIPTLLSTLQDLIGED